MAFKRIVCLSVVLIVEISPPLPPPNNRLSVRHLLAFGSKFSPSSPAIPEWENDMASLRDKDKGCPLLLVISASAKRCVDILR